MVRVSSPGRCAFRSSGRWSDSTRVPRLWLGSSTIGYAKASALCARVAKPYAGFATNASLMLLEATLVVNNLVSLLVPDGICTKYHQYHTAYNLGRWVETAVVAVAVGYHYHALSARYSRYFQRRIERDSAANQTALTAELDRVCLMVTKPTTLNAAILIASLAMFASGLEN